MWRSSAWTRIWACLACTAALAATPLAMAADQQQDPAETDSMAGPPRAVSPRQVLVVPTKGHPRSAISGGAVDVLLRSVLEDLNLTPTPSSLRAGACGQGAQAVQEARRAYLDLELEAAMEAALRARRQLLQAEAVLWACPELDAVELFIAQLHVDRHEETAAREMTASILTRGTVATLDPAKYTPDFQLLWTNVAASIQRPELPSLDSESLARLGARVGAKWVVAAALAGKDASGERLVLDIVATDVAGESADVTPLVLDASGGWGAVVRGALARVLPGIETRPNNADKKSDSAGSASPLKPPFYRRWWFWTAVGVVVVGGAAAAVGAAVANDDPNPTTVQLQM